MSIKVFPLAFDSLGVRSESTFVKAGKLGILIDPGVSLAPKRYGLPPSKPELEALSLSRKLIMRAAEKAQVAIVTHYHYDHHPEPNDDEMYEGVFKDKIVYAKEFENEVTASAKNRGKKFYKKVSELAKEIEICDDRSFDIEGVKITFSPPVWHGAVGSKVGRVVMVSIEKDGYKFLHGSDAQNLADPQALEWVLNQNPDFLIVDGYPTILVGWRVSKQSLDESMENIKTAIEKVKAEEIIMDHHIVRDIKFKEKMKPLYTLAEKKGKKLVTAAEHYGLENLLLEAWRKELHKGERKVDVQGYYRKLRRKIRL
jgi:predicted metallo-beta-lactamase superfamily hydrolase